MWQLQLIGMHREERSDIYRLLHKVWSSIYRKYSMLKFCAFTRFLYHQLQHYNALVILMKQGDEQRRYAFQ